jgi:uncharacterized membrane protein YgcG
MHRLGAVRRVIGLFAVLVLTTAAAGCGGSDSKKSDKAPAASNTQTVRFQKPEDPGPEPFTEPTDVSGSRTVSLQSSSSGGGGSSSGGSGPYGGSGSDKVCDRDTLIRYLTDNPDRRRAWAGVLGIDSDERSVTEYIAKLHPVTLTRDTQVTNHSFVNGRAVPFQSILQAGTAVLVDRYGHPVARCRCGNPLREPTYIETAKCIDCPPNYRPPTYCKLWTRETDYDYTDDYYSNEEYDKLFIDGWRDGPYVRCYEAYPDPPVVTIIDLYEKPPEPEPTPQYNPPPRQSQPYQRQPYDYDQHPPDDGTTGGGTTGGDTTGGDTTGGDTTGGGTTGGDSTGGGTTG